ncbi:hypothetical protein [Rhizobium hainanense]|uniref:Uncharacterized protein n=1 Tax=Rhizobium hainanense TaxID=52131 RepID=A0A1C3ULW3_9HYPH|nr:hypothetical protein [Rhizobium hainanense]SCB16490.1 hypothetical protein GA0061100_102613 [Rhizobium hainanense]
MTEQSDMDVFDSVISGASAPESTEIQTPVVEQTQTTQPRSDDGRFSAKQPDKAPTADTTSQPVTGTETQPVNGGVPVRAVQDEREKRQAAQQENETLRRELAEMRGQLQVLTTQRQPQSAQPQEKQPVTLWDDPDAFLKSQMSPFQSEIQQMREELWESRAIAAHGADKVEAAKKAAEALFNTPQGASLHQQITTSGNPFDNLVKWHQQQETLARVGGDPEAWLNAELEKKMNDPAFLAQAIERARASAASNTSRSAPRTEFAPSLSSLPSGGNAPAGDQDTSDQALFAQTTSSRRR